MALQYYRTQQHPVVLQIVAADEAKDGVVRQLEGPDDEDLRSPELVEGKSDHARSSTY